MSNAHLLAPLTSDKTLLPLYESLVPAGFPSPALDHMQRSLSLDELLDLQAPHTYIVRVSGESMTGCGIFDGDYLVVSRALEARSGQIVVACINGEACVKRLIKEHNQLLLRSENPAYSPRYILDSDELIIWGVVTHSLHKHLPHA